MVQGPPPIVKEVENKFWLCGMIPYMLLVFNNNFDFAADGHKNIRDMQVTKKLFWKI
jgi:hypothetical protein